METPKLDALIAKMRDPRDFDGRMPHDVWDEIFTDIREALTEVREKLRVI